MSAKKNERAKICLKKEVCNQFGYKIGDVIELATTDDPMVFAVRCTDDKFDEDFLVAGYQSPLDKTYCISFPAPLRHDYSDECVVLAKKGSLYIRFLRFRKDVKEKKEE